MRKTVFNKLLNWSIRTLKEGSRLDVIAIVLSIIAIYWSSAQYDLTKEHNKKSVQPILNFYIFNDVDSGFKLQNVGLGPAIVKGVKATNIETKEVYSSWEPLVRNKLNYTGEYFCSDTLSGSAHENGIERKLLTIKEKLVIDKNSGIEFSICYCSIYDDCWISGTEHAPQKVDSCKKFDYNVSC
jgi:hypothetical protein